MDDWADQVLSLLEQHKEQSTSTIVRELDFADKATALTVLKPLLLAGSVVKVKRGGYLYWSLPTRGPALLNSGSGLKKRKPTRASLISSNNDNDAPTNRSAPKKISLEGYKPDYTGTSYHGKAILEVLAQLGELDDLGLLDMTKVTKVACLDAGAVKRVYNGHANYDWLVEIPPKEVWVISIVWKLGSKTIPWVRHHRWTR